MGTRAKATRAEHSYENDRLEGHGGRDAENVVGGWVAEKGVAFGVS